MHVIATAGHIDHGKSSLVKTLTGTDPDRLPEEQARGMTIELGFARLDLGHGRDAAIIDVPGHERFVRHMVAGVGGIDLAVLVIAADESVMPQTREHLAILELLGIAKMVVALTKVDLVDADWRELVEDEVRQDLALGAFAGSPIVPCSSSTGTGILELRTAIAAALETVPDRIDRTRPRLPIDRIFTRAGHGTVVTGTLSDGTFVVGQEIELAPHGLHARIRGMQSHGRAVDVAHPGGRIALNLAGIEVRDIQRGMVACLPGTVPAARYLDLRIQVIRQKSWAYDVRAGAREPLYHNIPVSIHAGSAEAFGRLRLLDADTVAFGGTAWAQAILEEPIAVMRGDRCIVRVPSPAGTVAGGTVIAINPTRHRRFQKTMLLALERLSTASPNELVLDALAQAPLNLLELADHTGVPAPALDVCMAELARAGEIRLLTATAGVHIHSTQTGSAHAAAQLWTTPHWLESAAARAQHIVQDFHQRFPLRRGMPGESLREALGVRRSVWMPLLAVWREKELLAVVDDIVWDPTHRIVLSAEQERSVSAFLDLLARTPYLPPTGADLPPIDRQLLDSIVLRGDPIRLSETVFVRAAAYRSMEQTALRLIDEEGQVTVASLRDAMPTNRKIALALLEHLDSLRVTRRVGEGRVRGRASLSNALRG